MTRLSQMTLSLGSVIKPLPKERMAEYLDTDPADFIKLGRKGKSRRFTARDVDEVARTVFLIHSGSEAGTVFPHVSIENKDCDISAEVVEGCAAFLTGKELVAAYLVIINNRILHRALSYNPGRIGRTTWDISGCSIGLEWMEILDSMSAASDLLSESAYSIEDVSSAFKLFAEGGLDYGVDKIRPFHDSGFVDFSVISGAIDNNIDASMLQSLLDGDQSAQGV